MSEKKVDVLAAMDRARNVLAETYAKYQTKIGPFASQSQLSNVELSNARDAVAELIEASRESLRLLGMDRPVDPSDLLRDALARIAQPGDGDE